ncbi:DUF397 domain-containing protein [Streptomyces varsoviensis]|uniref:DUF397 domain-containing protein n=1 Tax=Streptomyces varsoviensis TaxID=67373 RepID=UPI0004CB163E|nr:DUF397 domain-containing protein [Streptomyces varsoviensis]
MTTETLRWFKSTHSGANGGECVEWAPTAVQTHGIVPIRDSKRTHGPTLSFTPTAWTTFVAAVKDGLTAA